MARLITAGLFHFKKHSMDIKEKLAAERSEINSLLERGVQFTTPRKGPAAWIHGGRPRKWTIREPYLGTLDRLSDLFLQMEIDDKSIQEDPMVSAKKMTGKTARLCAQAAAVAVLNNRIGIRLFTPFLARYFFWRIKPSTLIQIALLINTMGNYGDFTSSIRLMSSSRTTMPAPTAPTLVEQANED